MSRRWFTGLVFALCLASVAPLQAANPPGRYADISAYRRFLIYPHQQRGYAAMRRGDSAAAIDAFEHARALAPRSVGTALDLSNVYQRFGRPEQARAVLVQQLHMTPGAPRVLAALHALDAAYAQVDCARVNSDTCRARRGFEALGAGHLQAADRELDDVAFARSGQGLALRRALAQRAIHLGDMARADRQFQALDRMHVLRAAERKQWFNVLLALDRPRQARALQQREGLDSPEYHLQLAHLLARRGDLAVLAGYLRSDTPVFRDATQEKDWIYLLHRAARAYPGPFRAYRPQTPAGKRLYARLALPQAMADDDTARAERLLRYLPANANLQARFELALRAGHFDRALGMGRALDTPGSIQLDALSYQLLQAGGDVQALRWLVDAWPFSGRPDRGVLFTRLAMLATAHPHALGAGDMARLQSPLDDATGRSGQLHVLTAMHDCRGLRAVLPAHVNTGSAPAWAALGECYRAQRPGLAQYALARAFRLEPDPARARALAYQAFANRDYRTALKAWRALPAQAWHEQDLLAAADTALEGGQPSQARAWLDRYAVRVDAPGDRYWWLSARAEPKGRLDIMASDLGKAIALHPRAKYYLRLATIEQERGWPGDALVALQQAQALSPADVALTRRIGYAQWRLGDLDGAIASFERARQAAPDDPVLDQDLMYLNRQRGNLDAARRYAALAISGLDARAGASADPAESRELFALRRMHEELGRRWRVDADLILGDTVSSAANPIAPGVSYRSFFQAEVQYHIGEPWPRIGGGGLAAYARVFSGSGPQGDLWPSHAPMLGVGLHWQPWRSQSLLFSLERQVPLENQPYTRNDTMARISYSTAFGARFNQDWHPGARAWLTQNLYLDLAHYYLGRQTAVTADYRLGWQRRVAPGQAVEPYAHVQYNGLERGRGLGYVHDVRAGVGLRWNLWYDERRFDAYRRRFSIGIEFQHAFSTYLPARNAVFMTVGKHW